jgi:hypothetical protein
MRRALPGLLLGLAILATSGCGKTATISVLAQPWGTGQHQDCIYAHDKIYCVVPTANEVLGRRLDRASYVKDKKPVPRTEILFGMEVELVRGMEKLRPKIKEGEADTGKYETRFSTSPVDYSLWDCNKTGSASPAVSCKLTKKPEGKGLEYIEKKKAEAAADDFLRALTKEELARRCGVPVNSSQDSISYQFFTPRLWECRSVFDSTAFPPILHSMWWRAKKQKSKIPRGTFSGGHRAATPWMRLC